MHPQFASFHTFTDYQTKIINNFVLFDAPRVKTEEFDTGITEIIQECDQKNNIFQENQKSNPSSSDNSNLKKLRKNKLQKLKDIDDFKADDGRGGNCVAANLSKTLTRIIESNIKQTPQVQQYFRALLRKYEINSQKENTFILILILHLLAKQHHLSFQTYTQIVETFLESIKSSSENFIQKTKEQEKRKEFHLKNRKMYMKFASIVSQIFGQSMKNITKHQQFDLKDLQATISDVYERKQRETQKSMQKITSIILNHQELKEMFNCHQIDIEESFFEAIDFAFRRNLQKKCKQIKQKVTKVFLKLRCSNVIHTEEDKYLMCYLSLELIEEKGKMIWDEFILNLTRKQEFNKTKEELKEFQQILQKEIHESFLKLKQSNSFSSRKPNTNDDIQQQNMCQVKVEEEQGNTLKIFEAYQQIKKEFEF